MYKLNSPAAEALLTTVDESFYHTYYCPNHGVYQWAINREYKGCIICFDRHLKVQPRTLLKR
jgi:hypothetical protein